jgi:hypothetical protein
MPGGFGKMTIRMLAAAFALWLGSAIALAESAEQSIRKLLMDTFDKPGAPLVVDPVVAANDCAIADWIQDGHGGRALLKRRDGKRSLILCSGDGDNVSRGAATGRRSRIRCGRSCGKIANRRKHHIAGQADDAINVRENCRDGRQPS